MGPSPEGALCERVYAQRAESKNRVTVEVERVRSERVGTAAEREAADEGPRVINELEIGSVPGEGREVEGGVRNRVRPRKGGRVPGEGRGGRRGRRLTGGGEVSEGE